MSRITHDICDLLGVKHHTTPRPRSGESRSRRMVIAGGSGFLGQLLAAYFKPKGWEITLLTRTPQRAWPHGRQTAWDGRSLASWVHELEGADALINLAGRSVNCRYHARNRALIKQSRTESTRVLGEAISLCTHPPIVWLNASTATIYRHSYDQEMDEATGVIGATPEAKDAFSIEVATAWEETFEACAAPRTRKVLLRSAMVLGLNNDANNVYRVLRRLVRIGLGGTMGHGRQYVSWIHEEDFCRAVEFLIEDKTMAGPVNLAAPNPLPNARMMQLLRNILGVPFGLPASAWMLEIGAFLLRTETELILKSRNVVPGRLTTAGFQFRYPHMRDAFSALEQRLRGNPCGRPDNQRSKPPRHAGGLTRLVAAHTKSSR